MPEFEPIDPDALYILFGNPLDNFRELWQGPCCHGHPKLRYPCKPIYGGVVRPELSIRMPEGI
jgi:hypothetical protein